MQNLNTGDTASKPANPMSSSSERPRASIRPGTASSHAAIRPPDVLVGAALPHLDQDLLQRFLDLYLPVSEVDRAGGGPLCWLPAVCRLSEPAPVLRLALYALAAGRVAYVDGDAVLGKESLRCYGETLKLLQRILSSSGSPESKASDQVLAACQCLMIFEVLINPELI